VEPSPDGTSPDGTAAPRQAQPRSRAKKVWTWLRYVVGLGLAALALWALAGRRGELSGATSYLTRLNWAWLVVAVIAEIASLVAFGIIQMRLLGAGRVRVGVGRITAITFAVTAISNSMPAGPLISSVFAFRQYRKQGADEAFAGWTLGGVFVASSVSLSLVAAAGLAIAGAEGAGFDLVWVTVAVLVGALALGALFVQRRALVWLAARSVAASRRLIHWPKQETVSRLRPMIERLYAVKMSPLEISSITAWGLANWILDCGCLTLAYIALGFGVPWKALLLAYGAGQLAANLPVTPGGLGVVEGSMTIALVIFGGAETQTVAAVLLYRIISFWAELPVGWLAWGFITLQNRRAVRPVAEERSEEEMVAEAAAK